MLSGGALTWGVPQPELHSLVQVQVKAGRVVFKHRGHVALRGTETDRQSESGAARHQGDTNRTYLTSGKLSLANTLSSALFPHWLSPTTTSLHWTAESESIVTAERGDKSRVCPRKEVSPLWDSVWVSLCCGTLTILLFPTTEGGAPPWESRKGLWAYDGNSVTWQGRTFLGPQAELESSPP